MSENRKHDHKNRNDRPNDRRPQTEQVEVEEEDKWNPTPVQFDAYQLRDATLCNGNLKMLLTSRASFSLKELKDSTLHTAGTIEAQLSDWVKMGYVVEAKGRFSLNPTYQGR